MSDSSVSPKRLLSELLRAIEARTDLRPQLVDVEPLAVLEGLVSDSRAAGPGVAFIAIPGTQVDGHEFLSAVFDAGSPFAFVEAGRPRPAGHAYVELESTARALPWLASAYHGAPSTRMKNFGVTGTNGKTTCAHLLASIFRRAELPHARLGTTGNWIVDHEESAAFTTPFPIELQAILARAVGAGAQALVMEVSSHALAQGRTEAIAFDGVALTSFSQDHLDFHPTMEDYLAAKLKLAREYLVADGLAVAPVDDMPEAEAFARAARAAGARAWRASRGKVEDAELLIESCRTHPGGSELRLRSPVGTLHFDSPLVGDFNLDNLMVATGLAIQAGISSTDIESALSQSRGAPGRLQAVALENGRGPRVFVDYAHTPDAVVRALAALRPSVEGRLVVLLGCGGDRDRSKRPQMAKAAREGADLFWATSDNPRTENPEAILDEMLEGFPSESPMRRDADRARAIASAIAEADERDTILIAGKGHEDYQILGREKIHFDDREHALAALRARS